MKCDEAKPACQRCTRFGTECDGYGAIQGRRKPITGETKDLRRKATGAQGLAIQAAISVYPETGSEDRHYFQYFREETITELCAGYDEPLWNRILLQACHEAPFIQHITLSIAALGRAERAKQAKDSLGESIAHERYALRKYSTSLPEVRRYLASAKNPEPRMLLLVGILIYLFEFQQGNKESAIQQLRSTVALFRNMREINGNEYKHFHCTPIPRTFEDTVIDMIARLDTHLTMDQVTAQPAGGVTLLGLRHIHHTWSVVFPKQFPNIVLARRYLHHIQCWGEPNFARDATIHIMGSLHTMAGSKPGGPSLKRLVSVEEYTSRGKELNTWLASFKPLFDRIKNRPEDPEYLGGLVLQIQAVCVVVLMKSRLGFILDTPDTTIGGTEEEREVMVKSMAGEMLKLGWQLAADPRFMRCFTFDLGCILCLFGLLFATDDMAIGREVSGVLMAMRPRKEGVWDSCFMAAMADVVLDARAASRGLE